LIAGVIGALLVLGASKIMGLVGIDNGGAQVQEIVLNHGNLGFPG
jgi:serine protease Do